MANFSIKADLLKIRGAFVANINGRTATKRCLCIPLDDAGLFVGEKGVYLNLTAVEMQEPKYSDTHFIRVNLDREAYNRLSEEERRAIPILGGMHEMETQSRTVPVTTTVTAAPQSNDPEDDLPF